MLGRRTILLAAVVAVTALFAFVAVLIAGSEDVDRSSSGSAGPVERPSADNGTLEELEAVARAASGKPGEVAPPCPDEETVLLLKQNSIEFGPCDPFPEPGEQMVLPEQAESETEGEEVCISIEADRGVSDLDVDLPCAEGADLISSKPVEHNGQTCMEVNYIPREGADAVTELFCPDSES